MQKDFSSNASGLAFESPRLTHAETEILSQIEAREAPIVTSYQLARTIDAVYANPHKLRLYLKRPKPGASDYARHRNKLIKSRKILPDFDYSYRAFRVLKNPDLPADDVVCLVDQFAHVAYLSAMQRWGLTNRTPAALIISRPSKASIRASAKEIMTAETGEEAPKHPLVAISHPPSVRGRELQTHESRNKADTITVRGSYVRISRIGQTFADMLDRPDLCGGMHHVIDTWKEHSEKFIGDIITSIDRFDSSIVKCRAGYLIEEVLRITNPKVDSWTTFAQRGGSRKLDPSRPFSSQFSERWMISINA
jgi:predicted transcriptional regulator of viral defense system